MTKYAIIVAGGSGVRMGGAIPKQFLELNGKPLLWYSVETFFRAFDDIQIILVVPESYKEQGIAIANQTAAPSRMLIATGGVTRFHSVQNGLKLATDNSVVFVHDGVRCMVSEDLIRRCYQQALEKGSAIPCVPISDSVRIKEGNTAKVIDRRLLVAIQTPQTFRSEIILPAFRQKYNDSFTDEATVVEATGQEIFLIDGEAENIKVTVPADLAIAEQLFNKGFRKG